MSQSYIEYNFIVTPVQPGTEILIAELGYAGFESFVESEEGVAAYIRNTDWYDGILEGVQVLKSEEFEITFERKEIAQVNWNAEWEKNFEPIEVDERCRVRAPFHADRKLPYEIVIEPKMSFGTGHHETTFMMLQFLLDAHVKEQTVLDMGCGTAVLAILAEMKDASAIDAIDIDEWCFENSEENVQRNNCKKINVYQGDASMLVTDQKYDLIIANINRNILIRDLPIYKKSLKSDGTILLSGFYVEDLPILKEACNNLYLNFVEHKEKNKWVAAKFVTLN